jgi:hypothetical protein
MLDRVLCQHPRSRRLGWHVDSVKDPTAKGCGASWPARVPLPASSGRPPGAIDLRRGLVHSQEALARRADASRRDAAPTGPPPAGTGPPPAGTGAAERRRSARALCANDQYGPVGVVDNPARDAAEQHVRQPALPARADDDGASVVFGAEIEDRAPDVPIGARDERAGVEAHLARESGTLFCGRRDRPAQAWRSRNRDPSDRSARLIHWGVRLARFGTVR